MREGPKKTVSILLPLDLYEELIGLAEDNSRPVSAYIRQVLKAHPEYMGRFRKR